MNNTISKLVSLTFITIVALTVSSCGVKKQLSEDFQYSGETSIGNLVEASSNVNAAMGIPKYKNNVPEVLLSKKQYLLSWNPQTRNLNWVAWKLTASNLGSASRGDFAFDKDLSTFLQQNKNGYAVGVDEIEGDCLDKGHQVPSADRNSSAKDNAATFLMSNIIPQTAYMNRILWARLETAVRKFAKDGKEVYMVAGTIYEKDLGYTGPRDDIKIPSHNFKVVVAMTPGQSLNTLTEKDNVIAVIMPNQTSNYKWPNEDKTTLCAEYSSNKFPSQKMDVWKQFQTTLAEVQNRAGLELFKKITFAESATTTASATPAGK